MQPKEWVSMHHTNKDNSNNTGNDPAHIHHQNSYLIAKGLHYYQPHNVTGSSHTVRNTNNQSAPNAKRKRPNSTLDCLHTKIHLPLTPTTKDTITLPGILLPIMNGY